MAHGLELAWKTVIHMIDGFFAMLPNLMIAGLVFFAFNRFAVVAGRIALKMATRARVDRTLSNALSKLIVVTVNVFALLICATIIVPSFSADKLIAGLGITSVAIGFAFQNILQNFFAGLLLLWQKPFGIGDEIKCKEFEGTVEDIAIRTTLLRTYTGERIFIPNGLLFTEPLTVNTAYAARQIRFQMACGNVLPEKAVKIAKESLNTLESLATDHAPEIYTTSQSGTMMLDVTVWANPQHAQILRARNEATFAIQSGLNKYSEKQAKVA